MNDVADKIQEMNSLMQVLPVSQMFEKLGVKVWPAHCSFSYRECDGSNYKVTIVQGDGSELGTFDLPKRDVKSQGRYTTKEALTILTLKNRGE